MSRRHSAKYKIDRRVGENIWGRPKSPFNKRAYKPGQHGQNRRNKVSDFGMQLMAKQKLKGYYGDITEKQFSKIYEDAARMKKDFRFGDTRKEADPHPEEQRNQQQQPWEEEN